jgi:hypothetical protein
MKFGVFGILIVLFCSCAKDNVEPSNNIEGTWKWISTTQDTTFYEDTATSSNTQILNIIDTKHIDWKRNDTVFYNGTYTYAPKTSVTLGVTKLMMKLTGIPYEFMLNHPGDTLWLQEDKVSGRTYRFVKV